MSKSAAIAALCAALSWPAAAAVDLSLAATNDYDVAMPPAATNSLMGIGAGYDEDAYNLVRFEDVSFLLRALYERFCWASHSPHWGRPLNVYGAIFSLVEIQNSALSFNAATFFPWSAGVTNAYCYLASAPWFAEGAFACDDMTSWAVDGLEMDKYPPFDTVSASALISTNAFRTNNLILRTTPVSLLAITNNYHNLALLNHLSAGPFDETFNNAISNRSTRLAESGTYGFSYATNTVTDPTTHVQVQYYYASEAWVEETTNTTTQSRTYGGTVSDRFDFLHTKTLINDTILSVKATSTDLKSSTVSPLTTLTRYREDTTSGEPDELQAWRVSCGFNSKWTDYPFTNHYPIAYFVGLVEVSDMTRTDYAAPADFADPVPPEISTNDLRRYVYIFSDTATMLSKPQPAGDFYWYDFTLNRSKFFDFFMTESGIGADVPDPPSRAFPGGKIHTTVDGYYGEAMCSATTTRTKRVTLKDVYVIWYVTPTFRARVTSQGFNLN